MFHEKFFRTWLYYIYVVLFFRKYYFHYGTKLIFQYSSCVSSAHIIGKHTYWISNVIQRLCAIYYKIFYTNTHAIERLFCIMLDTGWYESILLLIINICIYAAINIIMDRKKINIIVPLLSNANCVISESHPRLIKFLFSE